MVNDGPARTNNCNNRIEITATRSDDIAFIKFASGQRRNVRERDRGSGVVAGVVYKAGISRMAVVFWSYGSSH